MSGTDHIVEWAAYCARMNATFETFCKGVDEFMSDPTWLNCGWVRLLSAIECAKLPSAEPRQIRA
jgi:hypothetical protein